MNSKYFPLKEGKLHYRVRRGSMPPVVLLHGTGGHSGSFNFMLECLADREVILPDLRGHGDSLKPQSQYTTREYAEDVAKLVAGLGYGDIILGGFSLGALISIDIAGRYPGLVSALVLIDPSIGTDKGVLQGKIQAFREAPPSFQDEDAATAYIIKKFGRVSESQLNDEIRFGFDRGKDGRFYRKYSADAAVINFKNRRENNLEIISRIGCPTLVLRAENSEMFSQDYYLNIMEMAKPNIQLATIEDCDHRIMFQRPDALRQAVASFLGFYF